MINRIKREMKWWYEYIKTLLYCIMNRDILIILGTPIHGNLGDQAIALAEYRLLQDYFPNRKIVEVPSYRFIKHTQLFKYIVGKKDILVHGGGFLGTLWMNEEEMFRKVLEMFSDNKITVFPQTIYVGEEEWEKKELEKSKMIYGSAKDLLICTRERNSYEFMEKEMQNIPHRLIPDMVLYLKGMEEMPGKSGALLCMRSDKEKSLNTKESDYIAQTVKKVYGENNVKYTDTIVRRTVDKKTREKEVKDKLDEFATSELIITDRLHGMVFAAIAGTPCIVFGNCNYKIRGVYEWIRNHDYIVFAEDVAELEDKISQMRHKSQCRYDNKGLLSKYTELAELINGGTL